jgi:hypothetical protein
VAPEVKQDPDVGPTNQQPSVASQLERTELASRGLKLRHQQTQAKLVEEANAITAWPKSKQEDS